MRTYKRVRLGDRKGAILLGGQKFTGQAGNPLLNNLSKEEIERSLTEFMSGDSKFNNAIRKHLFQRLKYATGNLLNSLKWKAKVSIDGVGNDFSVSVGVYLTNPELIDALLSGGELLAEGKHKIPTISELVKYVEAKRQYYSEMIRDRYKPTLHASRQSMKPKKMQPFRDTPILDIAGEIRAAMVARVEGSEDRPYSLPPTKGSDYTLLGYWKITGNRKEDGSYYKFWKPKYKKWSTPLYTLNSQDGEINIEINECLQRYFDKMFDPRFGQAIFKSTQGYSLLQIMNDILPEINADKSLNDKLYMAAEHLFDMVDILQQRVKSSGQDKWKFDQIYKAQMTIQTMKIDRMTKAYVGNQGNIDMKTNDVLNEIKKLSLSTRKRHAARKRR